MATRLRVALLLLPVPPVTLICPAVPITLPTKSLVIVSAWVATIVDSVTLVICPLSLTTKVVAVLALPYVPATLAMSLI